MNYFENSMLKLNLEQTKLIDNFVHDVFIFIDDFKQFFCNFQ